MPLCLKSLELHGYKTFAARINFEFAGGITAIVGPNGSGKSNIADALRWVLGEQSYSLLRAKKTEDMIFAGSEQRTRAGMASATVVFDNSNSWLPVEFTEVGLTRRAYRDGRNEYLMNGQQVRLRDIYELLAQSGLSERTYTILGQGLVDASLALKADERRKLFEEAAGIGLYRSRREETLRRLDTTRRNLDRVLDILAELEPRLKSLERQSRRAQEYGQVQADLKAMLRDWYGYHWHRSQALLIDVRSQGNEQESQLREVRDLAMQNREEVVTYRGRLQGLRARLNSWHRQSAQFHTQREEISLNLAVLDERKRSLTDNLQAMNLERDRLEEEMAIAKDRLAEAITISEHLQVEFNEAQVQAKAVEESLADRQAERKEVDESLRVSRQKLEDVSTRSAHLQARLEELKNRIENQAQRLSSVNGAIQVAADEVEVAKKELQTKVENLRKVEIEYDQARSSQQELSSRMADQEILLQDEQVRRNELVTEKTRLETQLEIHEQAEKSLTGYGHGSRLLLEAIRRGQLNGSQGALSALLEVPPDLELAVAAALSEYLDGVILISGESVEQAISLLGGTDPGRAAIMPLDWLAPGEPQQKAGQDDCLGVASELVGGSAELRPLIDALLGQVFIARDRPAARRILAGKPTHVRAVTLDGEVFTASGLLLAGKLTSAGALTKTRQLREIKTALEQVVFASSHQDKVLQKAVREVQDLKTQVSDSEALLQDVRVKMELTKTAVSQTQVTMDAAQAQHDWRVAQKASLEAEIQTAEAEREQALAQLAELEGASTQISDEIRSIASSLNQMDIDEFQVQLNHWTTRVAVTESTLREAQSRQEEREQTIERMKGQLANIFLRIDEGANLLTALDQQKETLRDQESLLQGQLEELRLLIEPAENQLAEAEAEEAVLQEKDNASQQNLARLERQNTQVQLEIGRKQEGLESLRQKIEDDFGLVQFEYSVDVSGPVPLPFDGLVEQLGLVADIPLDLEESLTRQRAQLRRMGPVNPEAQSEYEAVKERCEFLQSQLKDLRKAESDLHQVIAELDEITRIEFSKTFTAVAEEFRSIFHRLFGGGSARLVLTDPDNLTDTGIEIQARLPGRREQGLSLLSGGERSLTAIALVFALLKVSPTPVCVMDEVDAMLDEANVGRFRDLLDELSKDTQFVIITHNRNTVQAADVIYGVTMGRDSTSQVISLKLDEVSDEYLR
ncbi:MAG: chromosome segregation protein SMC [Chloroflexota bacterium]